MASSKSGGLGYTSERQADAHIYAFDVWNYAYSDDPDDTVLDPRLISVLDQVIDVLNEDLVDLFDLTDEGALIISERALRDVCEMRTGKIIVTED